MGWVAKSLLSSSALNSQHTSSSFPYRLTKKWVSNRKIMEVTSHTRCGSQARTQAQCAILPLAMG